MPPSSTTVTPFVSHSGVLSCLEILVLIVIRVVFGPQALRRRELIPLRNLHRNIQNAQGNTTDNMIHDLPQHLYRRALKGAQDW